MVSKPVVPVELMARVRIHLEKRLLIHDLRTYRERVAQELASARAMQQALLPQTAHIEALADRHRVRIGSHFEASSELGGDIWDIVTLNDHRFGVYMADFSGHGVTAALNTFRLHTLIQELPPPPEAPGVWLAAVSRREWPAEGIVAGGAVRNHAVCHHRYASRYPGLCPRRGAESRVRCWPRGKNSGFNGGFSGDFPHRHL